MDTHAPKTHLSQALGLSTEEQKARYDALAKELLGDKQVLAHIMQGAVAEFRNMEIPDIAQCIENDPQIGTVEIYPGATNGRNTENKSSTRAGSRSMCFWRQWFLTKTGVLKFS